MSEMCVLLLYTYIIRLGFEDLSPEEVRLETYNAKKENTMAAFVSHMLFFL